MPIPPGIPFTYLGHSTFLITTPGGRKLLIDPWVQNNPRCPAERKNLGKIDMMLVTHGHYDHIGDAVEIGKETGARIVAVYETAYWLGGKGIENTEAMNKGGTLAVDGIKITMVHADHSCGILDGDKIVYGGEACGFVIEFENGYRAYHAGDTAVFGDMRLIGEIYKPDIALLPIGDRFVMSPTEAAHACRLLGITHVIPMHYATFPVLTGTPDALRVALGTLRQSTEVVVLEPGETLAR